MTLCPSICKKEDKGVGERLWNGGRGEGLSVKSRAELLELSLSLTVPRPSSDLSMLQFSALSGNHTDSVGGRCCQRMQ